MKGPRFSPSAFFTSPHQRAALTSLCKYHVGNLIACYLNSRGPSSLKIDVNFMFFSIVNLRHFFLINFAPFCSHYCLPLHKYLQSEVKVFTLRVIVYKEKKYPLNFSVVYIHYLSTLPYSLPRHLKKWLMLSSPLKAFR